MIGVESLNVRGMQKNRRLAKHVADAALGGFLLKLGYKAEIYGAKVIAADQWYPISKTCSVCGRVKDELTLAEVHIGYENVEPWPLEEVHRLDWNPDATDAYRVTKMAYPKRNKVVDRSRVKYNADITLSGIPSEAHEYRLGNRSALDWLIDRYRVTTHKASGIVNDPNDWRDEVGDPRYILDLIGRVTTVSVETMKIVRSLPELPI